MAWYSCKYCQGRFTTFTEIISHICDTHGQNNIQFTRQDGTASKLFNFKVIPDLCREQGREITIKSEEEKIHISRTNVVPKDSPCSKYVKSHEGTIIGDTTYQIKEDEGDIYYTEIISLLPTVIDELKNIGQLEEFLSFHKLVSEKKFPLGNIAFLLFLDVVRWYGLESTSSTMRYSPEIKLFWKTGLRLFHGRFLKFMSGPKCTGKSISSGESPGLTFASDSEVNFIVPDRKVLQEEKKFVDENTPGILLGMIDTITVCDPKQSKTYKICVDGKKINPSSKGEVRLWGYEDSPTFDEKQVRLAAEKEFFEDFKDRLSKLSEYGHTYISTCDDSDNEFIQRGCTKSVQLLSQRIRDLRQLKVKKDIFLIKLFDKCESDWRNSQFAMVISSIKTTIYKIENCIDELLQCNDAFCKYAAIISKGSSYIHPEKQIPLSSQGNLVYLSNTEATNDPSLINLGMAYDICKFEHNVKMQICILKKHSFCRKIMAF